MCAAVAVPESSCRKLSAVRSAGQQRACRALEIEQGLIGGDRVAFGHPPLQPHPPHRRVEAGFDVGYAADDGLLPRDHGGPAHAIRGYQRSGQVTAADVLGQSAGNLLRQVGGRHRCKRRSRFRTAVRATVRSCTSAWEWTARNWCARRTGRLCAPPPFARRSRALCLRSSSGWAK